VEQALAKIQILFADLAKGANLHIMDWLFDNSRVPANEIIGTSQVFGTYSHKYGSSFRYEYAELLDYIMC
jgi:hypothetical protein